MIRVNELSKSCKVEIPNSFVVFKLYLPLFKVLIPQTSRVKNVQISFDGLNYS